MKVLITGVTGFIGNELLNALQDKFDLFGIVRYVTGRIEMESKCKVLYGDIKDYFTIKNIMKVVQPEIVCHLASISAVSYSYDHPQEIIENNLLGLINIAEACKQIPSFKQFLFAGTSEEYGNNGFTIQKEQNPLRPSSPYGISKLGCESYLEYMKEAYSFPVTILRPFNTYGRTRDHHFLVERTIYQMLTSNKVYLIDPDPVRDLLYISDHIKAYEYCIDNEKAIGQVLNFCTGKGYKICEVVEKIKNIIGFEGDIIWYSSPPRPSESKIIVGDYSKVRKILGWEPKIGLDEGLSITINKWREIVKCNPKVL